MVKAIRAFYCKEEGKYTTHVLVSESWRFFGFECRSCGLNKLVAKDSPEL